MVVRRFMNKTGVLKVFLIGSRKYAYRLNFRRAKVPDWAITEMSNILVKKQSISSNRLKSRRTPVPRPGVDLIPMTVLKPRRTAKMTWGIFRSW